MYCMYQDREELEDDLYAEDGEDSEGSEVDSELEFHLYSQLHYSANAGLTEEEEDEGEKVEEGRDGTTPGATSTPGPTSTPGATQTHNDGDREQEPGGGSSRESRAPSPDVEKLLQLLEEKKKKKKEDGEKPDKQQKKKRNKGHPKTQRCFEEVIVINSSPDVIFISEDNSTDEDDDDDDEEEGICALKGRNSNQLKTSTPAHQGSQKMRPSVPVSVDSSSSQSDSQKSSSDSSDSSDSDDVENWMILGRGNQEGDQRISLNLEGESDSSQDAEEEERSWLVSSKDKEAQIYNKDKGSRLTPQRMANRYYTNKSIECRNCKKNGHLSKNCPLPKKLSPCFLCGTPGHVVSECPNRHCNNCGLPGHLYSSCIDRAHWHQWCERCSMTGHSFGGCPEIWRQYHITTKAGPPVRRRGEDGGRTPASCYNCSRKGHFGHACKNKRMFNGTYPSIPFINHYDSKKDIKYREKWVTSKVKDLKRHGLIPDGSQTPLTPGPPHKRQKLNHHKNNHQSNHTPHHGNHTPHHGNHTPHHGNHTPHHGSGNHKRSHIFFHDSNETPKTNKSFNKQRDGGDGRGGSKTKTWKPKRPVPTSRDPLPPAKVMVDEADDFPRGGGRGQDVERKRKRKWKGIPDGHAEGRPDRLGWTVTGDMKGSGSKGKKKWKNQKKKKKNDKDPDAHMYPKDENLFIIKQKKRRR